MPTDLISVIANLAIALSFIVAVIFGIAQVKAAARDRRERLTLDTLRQFQTHEFSGLIHFIITNKVPSNNEELQALPPKDYITFIQMGQEMESLGILVAEGLVNIDLIDKTLGSFVTLTWKKYEPLYKDVRKSDPFMGEYFQWLAERIDERMKACPREPFYKNGKLRKARNR